MAGEEVCACKRGIDYYGVLSLNRNCNDLEIRNAYRRLAIRHNPERRKDEEDTSAVFALAAEAYDVLSDPLKRAVYDQYGEEGLKSGVPGPEGFIEPYVYHGDPMKTYREFFGTESPYPDLLSVLQGPMPLFELPPDCGAKRKEEPLIKTLYLTLSEVYFGGIKKMKIQKQVLVGDNTSKTVTREKILTIPFKPGIPTGTEIVFPEEGDQSSTRTPADIIFVMEDRPHETFRREGSDLHMTVDIFLREALTGTVVTVATLDERFLRIPITSVITPDYKKEVVGEGLPLPTEPKRKGNLIIRFNIEFPVYLPLSSKEHVKRAFETDARTTDAEYVHRLILANKMRRNVDEDIPLRRSPSDEANLVKLICNS